MTPVSWDAPQLRTENEEAVLLHVSKILTLQDFRCFLWKNDLEGEAKGELKAGAGGGGLLDSVNQEPP